MTATAILTVNVHGAGPEAREMPEAALVARFGHGNYAYNIGLARILDTLRTLGLRATFFWPVYEAERVPHLLERCLKDGHEIASHGIKFEDQGSLGDDEPAHLEAARDRLAALTGTRPVGFRSPSGALTLNTFAHLQALGYLYDSSAVDDDAPYPLDADGAPGMVELPWAEGLSDATHFGRKLTQDRAFLFMEEEFDALVAVDGYACLTLHPRADHGIARASRLRRFAEFVGAMQGRHGVRFLTAAEAAQRALSSPK